jgi:formylglycine-generating enzyme required for sulfatase activity
MPHDAREAVDSYCLDRTEVTVAAYGACVAAKVCTLPHKGFSEDWQRPGKTDPACNWERSGASQYPINCVDWIQASSYCAWKEARLPTEAEWVWAARGGERNWNFPWGNEDADIVRVNTCGTECVTWIRKNYGQTEAARYGDTLEEAGAVGSTSDPWPTTAPVASLPRGANPWKIEDLVGNVWEWMADVSPVGGRSIRGGGWMDTSVTLGMWRGKGPTDFGGAIGFRCAQ